MEKSTNKEEKLYDRFTIVIDSLEIATVSENPDKPFDYKYIESTYSRIFKTGFDKSHVFQVNEETYLVKQFSNIRKYDNEYLIIIDGLEAANMFINSRRDDPFIRIKIRNEIFYTDSFLYYAYCILNTFPVLYHHVSYLEIAHDSSNNTTKDFAGCYLSSNKYAYGSELKYQHKGNASINALNNGKTYTIGKTDAKQIVLYNKSLELKSGKKEYIKRFHIANHLKGDVHRVEARLKRRFLKDYDHSIEFLSKLESIDFLKCLFVKAVGSNLIFKDLSKRKYVNRNKKHKEIHIVDLEKVSQKTLAPIKKTNTINLDKDRSHDKMLREIVKEIRKHEPSDNLDLLTTAFKNNYYREMLQKVKKAVRKHASCSNLTIDSCKEQDYLSNPAYHAKQIFLKKKIGDIYCETYGKEESLEKDQYLLDKIVDGETMPMPVIKSVSDSL